MTWVDRLNDYVAHSRVGKYFQLDHSGARRERKGTKFTTEIRAGLTTFFAMAYIISVNASIISSSGGTCVCNPTEADPVCDNNQEYMDCVYQVKLDLIMGTTIIAMISSILIGVFANLPLGMAPGMGLNAYFTYTVVGYHGSGKVSYETALAAVFIEGIIFFVLSILGIRQWLARIIPMSIKIAMGCGIGLYLCFIGLQSSAGIGLVTLDKSTLVTLGGCPMGALDADGVCQWGHMTNGTTYMGILGLVIMSILLLYRVRGAILISIVFIAITSWPRNNAVTYFPYTQQGDMMFNYFKNVVSVHGMKHVLGKFNFDLSGKDIWIALITFLYVDIMDTTGTMYSMANYGGFTDKAGDFEHSTFAFMCDAASITIGSCFGSSPCTAFVESGAGIAEGGRTGITAIAIAFGFFVSIFFSPIFASFPPWSTGPALIVVGSMMLSGVRNINWDYPNYFKNVVSVHGMKHVLGKFNFDLSGKDIWIALITFLYVDIMDTTGTMYSMANYGGFTDKAGDFEHSTFAFMCDAASITIGSCFGSSPCTAFVESGAGIAEGGRTGITAIAIAFGFFVSIFFSPIFASFPPWSTGPALIVVGSMMLSGVRNINWDYPGDAIPAFITLAVMPFTYSIAYGVIGGILSYVVINGFVYLVDKISRGYIRPDYSLREDWWTAALSRPFLPTWIRFLIAKARGQEFDWHQDEYEFEDDEFQHPQVISDPVMEKNSSQQMMVDGISGHSLNETASIPGRGYSEKM
ncbi:Putative Nucleoside transporter [Rhizopus microsporus]|nr:Putative Nucleoside transporter [Rhizopus microsporus]